jgi:hypothetical protein
MQDGAVLISPSDHYRLYETVANSSVELSEFIAGVDEVAAESDCDVYWRGQIDHRWGITSSLARLTDSPTTLTDAHLNAAEAELLQEAKRWVTATPVRPETNLDWLALLQHHWIPTRLLDFTPDALVATFFAVESLDDVEGRLFAIAIPRSGSRLLESEVADLEIRKIPQGQVRLWTPDPGISPRVAAQGGVFVLGRLPSTYPARHVWDESMDCQRLMTRTEVVSVMSLPFYFIGIGRKRRDTKVPSCFTAKIHIDKGSVREQLARTPKTGSLRPPGPAIDHGYCYPDVDGMNRYSRALLRIRRGIG